MAEASALWARHLAEGTAHLDRSLKEARRRAAAGKPKAGWPDPPAKQARGARNPPSAGHKPEPRAQRPRRSSSSGADGNETRRAEQRRRSPRPGAPNAPLAPKARKTSLAGGAARFLSAVLAPPGLKLGITGTAALLTGVAAYAFSQRGNDKPTDDELRGVLELQYRALLVLNLRLRANEGLTRDQWLQECPPSIAQAMAMVFRFGHAIRGPLDGLGTTVTDDVRTADQLREALASGQKPSEQTRRWARQQLPVLAEAIDGLLGLSGDHGVPGLLGHKGGTLYVLGRHEGGFAYLALDKSATVHPAK